MTALLRRALAAPFAAALLLAAPSAAPAEEWGGIVPGTTVVDQVRARYGAPSREARLKVEGYDTLQWVYEGSRAPEGIVRMTVDYGLLTPEGYKPTVVRMLRLEPKPKVFGRSTVAQGWGLPDGVTRQNDEEVIVYRSGLIVTFDKEGLFAVLLTFTPPQPPPPASAAPKR
jgi:hypothetical protein